MTKRWEERRQIQDWAHRVTTYANGIDELKGSDPPSLRVADPLPTKRLGTSRENESQRRRHSYVYSPHDGIDDYDDYNDYDASELTPFTRKGVAGSHLHAVVTQSKDNSKLLRAYSGPSLGDHVNSDPRLPQTESCKPETLSPIPRESGFSEARTPKVNDNTVKSRSNTSRSSDRRFSVWTSSTNTEIRSMPLEFIDLEPYRAALIVELLRSFLAYRRLSYTHVPTHGNESQLMNAQGYDNNTNAGDCSAGSPQPSLSMRKRCVNGDDLDDLDDNNGRPPIRRCVEPTLPDSAPEKVLACPFSKNNPLRYNECYKYTLPRIHRLK